MSDNFEIVSNIINEVARSAFETLLWSEGFEGRETDDSVVTEVYLRTSDFLSDGLVWSLFTQSTMTPEYFGHHFILSANGHGSGFFDVSPAKAGLHQDQLNKLQELSHLHSIELYEGDDDVVYVA